MDIWKPGEKTRPIVPTLIGVIGGQGFSYLDMEMRFDGNQDLCFGVYTKPNYQTKYLNIGSTHLSDYKRAITRGVSIRTAGLTTKTAQNSATSMSIIYPKIHAALQQAGYLKDSQLPKLGKIISTRERERMEAEMRKEERDKDNRSTYLFARCSGH